MVPAGVPPAFQEASSCSVCGSNFGTFKRRHHCRACGRSLCNEHSSSQKALPQFGLLTPVRVCKDCFEESDREAPASNQSEKVEDAFTTLKIDDGSETEAFDSPRDDESQAAASEPEKTITSSPRVECKCGMPLCICTPEEPSKVPTPPPQTTSSSSKQKRVAPAPKHSTAAASASTKASPSLFFSSGQTNQINDDSTRTYNVSGEGIREAIKNGDASAVKDLLIKGVDPNFTDKQGMSLLHLAVVFNLTEIAFMLMDAGASVHSKNSQGETPLDCAQTTLQYKLQHRLEQLDLS